MIYTSSLSSQCRFRNIYAGSDSLRIHNFSRMPVPGKIINWVFQTANAYIQDATSVKQQKPSDWSNETVHMASVLFQTEVALFSGEGAAKIILGTEIPIAKGLFPIVTKHHYLTLLSFSNFEIAVDLAPSQFSRIRPFWKDCCMQVLVSKTNHVLFDITSLYGGQWKILPNEIIFLSET